MAITITQNPDNIHSVFIPEHYTWQTDLLYQSNFRFKYVLKDIDGIFFEGLTVPLENNLSFNNPNEVLRSKTEFNFNPSIYKITNIPNNCVVYQEKVSEVINGGDTEAWSVKTALRYSDTRFEYSDYLLENDETQDFLVSMPNTHNIRINDDFTFRTYNGGIDASHSINYGIYQTFLSLNDPNPQASSIYLSNVVMTSMSNPYMNTHSSDFNIPTKSGDNFNIEIPAGLKNITNQKFSLHRFTDGNGVLHNGNQTLIYLHGNGIDNKFWFAFDGTWYHITIDNYDFCGYRWPNGDSGRITKTHNFKVIGNCQFDSINVAWENSKGGVDYYLFTKANEKYISTKKDIYDMNINQLNISNGSVLKNIYNKGKNVYKNNIETFYELHTDFLNQEEINGLEDLFHSTNVYMNINNEWVYVISVEKKATIFNKKRKGLKKYKLNFLIGEKITRN